ncbi:hypothetical protein ANN_12506 [Periplaneta americana]|uniref:Uncharacterized protein n=1 Tax=Periplaneta americana TaxID=6978 RepID=A0ABQ8TI59_PERAM|nr:hypothetical protein ANN_12506 [Periplaneta americana]
MAGLCEGGNEPPGSLKANYGKLDITFSQKDCRSLGSNAGPPECEASPLPRRSVEEMILRDMLLELNDSCEQYGMKVNANKTKIMVIGGKIQKINLRILNEAVGQMDSFKYLGCSYYKQYHKLLPGSQKEDSNSKGSF